MIRVLSFDTNLKAKAIETTLPEKLEEKVKNYQLWVSLQSADNIRKILPKIILRTQEFVDDLLEEQRPRLQEQLTLEPNDDTYKVIILRFPTNKILIQDDSHIQLCVIIVGKSLFTITNRDHELNTKVMEDLLKSSKSFTLEQLLITVIEKLIENAIKVVQNVEERIEELEKLQLKIRNSKTPNLLTQIIDLKGRLYSTIKDTRADLEVIRELISEKAFDTVSLEHAKDRLLFLLDQLDNQRNSLSDVVNIYLSLSSHILNRRLFWLAVIGSLLAIPTIISGFFGVNLPLPNVSFWHLASFTLLAMGLTGIFMSLFFTQTSRKI